MTALGALGINAVVRISTVDAFVTELALIDVVTINARTTVDRQIAVINVLAAHEARSEKTIATLQREGRIIAVFTIHHGRCRTRTNFRELIKLLKKRSAKVKVTAVLQWIVRITPPHIDGINRKRLVGGVDGNDVPSGLTALALIKMAIVSEAVTSNATAGCTERGFRNGKSAASNGGREFF